MIVAEHDSVADVHTVREIAPEHCHMRIYSKFGLTKDDVVTFADIMGSAAVPEGDNKDHGNSSTQASASEDDESSELIARVRRGHYDV